MKHFCLSYFLFILCTSACFSQSENLKIPFVAYWAIGDTYDFTISKIKTQWKNGEISKSDTSQYVARFEVLDSTASSYSIQWTTLETLAQTRSLPVEVRDAIATSDLQNLTYTTDELGAFVSIENWEQISESMEMVFEELLEKMQEENKKLRGETFDNIMRPIVQAYTSKEGLEQNIFKELQFFHFPFGAEFTEGDTLFYEDYLPNMMGGEELTGIAKLYVEKVDPANAYCVLKRELDLDSKEVVKVLREAFAKMGLKDKELKKALKTARFDIRDRHSFEYIYDPGIPTRIEIRRESDFEIAGEQGLSEDIVLIEWLGE